MHILITGSSGLIGTNLALQLLKNGNTVMGVDKRINTWTDKIPLIKWDLCSPLSETINILAKQNFDLVVHLAANAKVHELVIDPLRALENINTTYNILELCRKSSVPIMFGSSREVYGDVRDAATNESHPINSKSPYSASKIAGEALVRSYDCCYGITTLILRFSNVYGRYDNDLHRMERVMPLFIRKIGKGQQVTVYGKNKVLDFTYIDDVISAICSGIQLLFKKEITNETINIASGRGFSLINLVNEIGINLRIKPNVKVLPSRPGEITHYIADISKANLLLGYKPTTFLSEGVRKVLSYSETSFLEK